MPKQFCKSTISSRPPRITIKSCGVRTAAGRAAIAAARSKGLNDTRARARARANRAYY